MDQILHVYLRYFDLMLYLFYVFIIWIEYRYSVFGLNFNSFFSNLNVTVSLLEIIEFMESC